MRNPVVFRAARASLSASSFADDIPWLSGVAASQANGAAARSGCANSSHPAANARPSTFPVEVTAMILSPAVVPPADARPVPWAGV